MYDFGKSTQNQMLQFRNAARSAAHHTYILPRAAGSFKPADRLSEGTSYFRQICDIVDKSRQMMWLL